MADKQTATKGGASRGKLILIAVLTFVLGGVLYWQFGGGGSAAEPTAYIPRRRPAVAPAAETAAAKAEKKAVMANAPPPGTAAVVDTEKWKSPDLATVIDYDPFALPPTFPKKQVAEAASANGEDLVAAAAAEDERRQAESAARLQKRLEELQQQGVHVIVREHDKYVAMIGDQTVHVGDTIEGFTVTEIDPNGVRIERKATP